MWFLRKVQRGTGMGKKIGFPTLNFLIGSFGDHFSPGVYSCELRIGGKNYSGALYFGPQFSTQKFCLEVNVQDFEDDAYGQFVRFSVGKKIREPRTFGDLEKLKEQIGRDVRKTSDPLLFQTCSRKHGF